jgi:hypothetical protein
VGRVIGQAVQDAGCAGIVVLDSASPEGGLARAWAAHALGGDRVWTVDASTLCDEGIDPVLLNSGDALPEDERERAAGRLLATRLRALLAHPANKTALLLAPDPPPEPFLPLGDLFASQVAMLAGAWSAPQHVRDLAQSAGGIDALDRTLEEMFDRRLSPERATAALPASARQRLLDLVEASRFRRRRMGLVPKLGARTIGIDLFA